MCRRKHVQLQRDTSSRKPPDRPEACGSHSVNEEQDLHNSQFELYCVAPSTTKLQKRATSRLLFKPDGCFVLFRLEF